MIGYGVVTNLIRGVIDHKVHYKLHLPILQLIDKLVHPQESHIWVNILVIRNVVSHIQHRTLVYYFAILGISPQPSPLESWKEAV